jgi:uncharacterized membrane protein YcaP (DUF421 family)
MLDVITLNLVTEVVLRTTIIFLFTFLLIRLRSKRQLAQFNLFDVIVVLALGTAVGDVMVYSEDNVSLVRSLISITTLIVLVNTIEYILARSPSSIVELIHGKAITLVKDGKLVKDNLKKSNITEEELRSKLREKNINYYSEVRLVQLEPDGDFSIIRKKASKK